jgi:hypothetical protein
MIVLLVLGGLFLGVEAYRMYHNVPVKRRYLTAGAIITVIGAIGYIQAITTHFGLRELTATRTETIKPATTIAGVSFISTQSSDSKTNVRYTYMRGKKTYQTLSEHATTTVTRTNKKTASLKTTIKQFKAVSTTQEFIRLGTSHEIDGDTAYTLSLPEDWYIVTDKQLAELEALAQKANDQIATDVSAEVSNEMAAASASDPTVLTDATKQTQIQDNAIKVVTDRVNVQLKNDVLAKLVAWKK